MQSPFAPISSSLSSIPSLSSSGIGSGTGIAPVTSDITPLDGSEEAGGARSFKDTLAGALNTVNETMDGAKKATDSLLNGSCENIHDVTIAGAKAEVMMKLTTTITSKLAQATTQLFQMQV